MYFLSEEEKRLVLRRLLPQARETNVAPELRGWNWHQPPLSPVYETKLGIFEIAGKYCPSARDVYLRRVQGLKARPNRLMVEGGLLHRVVADMVIAVKRAIYLEGVDCLGTLEGLGPPDVDESELGGLSGEQTADLMAKVKIIWQFERHRIIARVQEALARQPAIGPDALVALALPVTVEQKLDGSFLGLSSHLSADAFAFAEPMIVDIKFGPRQPFHRLSTTGYALVMESIYEYPISLGCVVYPQFKDGHLVMDRDFHNIDDELRQWFIDERDDRMRMVEEELDPGLAQECYEECPYWQACHPE
ncbi:MAG: type I-A CRISPR-associated protein Cas4/Csa1 [Chloroflexota bacterium]